MNPQPWPRTGPVQQIYQAAHQQAFLHRPGFKFLLAKIVGQDDFEIKVDIKRFASFQNKIERGKDPDAIHDVLRAAILTDTPEDNEIVADRINALADVRKEEFKTENEMGYRGAYHFKIWMMKPGRGSSTLDGMICEIIVLTKTLWAFKEVAHPNYDRQERGTEVYSIVGCCYWLYTVAQQSER